MESAADLAHAEQALTKHGDLLTLQHRQIPAGAGGFGDADRRDTASFGAPSAPRLGLLH
jgi:hypothetical protein